MLRRVNSSWRRKLICLHASLINPVDATLFLFAVDHQLQRMTLGVFDERALKNLTKNVFCDQQREQDYRVKQQRMGSMKSSSMALIIGFAISLGLAWSPVNSHAADKKPHRLAVQVSTNDPASMNLALNNVVNVAEEYSKVGEEVEIEVVAYGPGLHMLRDDTSPVKTRIKSISESMPYVKFAACGNTQENMKKAEGKDIPLVSQAKIVKAGVVRLMELQEQGWSYVRP